MNNKAVSAWRWTDGWRPIVCRIDKGWCNRLKWVKAFTHWRTHTYINTSPHRSSSFAPRESIFHAFKLPCSDKPLTTSAYCDTFVGPEEVSSTMPPLTGVLERKHTLFCHEATLDWLAQSNFSEWEMTRKALTPIYLFFMEPQIKMYGGCNRNTLKKTFISYCAQFNPTFLNVISRKMVVDPPVKLHFIPWNNLNKIQAAYYIYFGKYETIVIT